METRDLAFFQIAASEPSYLVEGYVKEFGQELHVWDFKVIYQKPGARSIPDSIWRVIVGEKTYLRVQLREFYGDSEENNWEAAYFVFESVQLNVTDKC